MQRSEQVKTGHRESVAPIMQRPFGSESGAVRGLGSSPSTLAIAAACGVAQGAGTGSAAPRSLAGSTEGPVDRLESKAASGSSRYVLATGQAGLARLETSERIYGPHTRRLFEDVRGERNVGDGGVRLLAVGCGSGAQLPCLAAVAGVHGSLTLVDSSAAQIRLMEARVVADAPLVADLHCVVADICASDGPTTILACAGNELYDVAYARFLLVHLPRPALALEAMVGLLKPGGVLACDEHDVGDIRSLPERACLDNFVALLDGLARNRGVNFRGGRRLPAWLAEPSLALGPVRSWSAALVVADTESKSLAVASLQEGASNYIAAGLATEATLGQLIEAMWQVTRDPDVRLCVGSQWQAWATKRPA